MSLQSTSDSQKLIGIKKLLELHRGDIPLMLHFSESGQKLKLPNGVDGSSIFLSGLSEIVGEKNMTIKKAEATAST